MALVLECRQTPYRATLLLLGSELEQPFVLLGMKDTLEPKIRKALPENILLAPQSGEICFHCRSAGKNRSQASSKFKQSWKPRSKKTPTIHKRSFVIAGIDESRRLCSHRQCAHEIFVRLPIVRSQRHEPF